MLTLAVLDSLGSPIDWVVVLIACETLVLLTQRRAPRRAVSPEGSESS